MTKALGGLLFILLMTIVVGCKGTSSVVGLWRGSLLGQDVTTEFKDDKTLTISMKEGQMGATLNGNYTAEPKMLTITLADYKLKNVPDTLTPLAKQLYDPLKGKVYKLLYHFNSEDELAVTYNGKVDILKRDKID